MLGAFWFQLLVALTFLGREHSRISCWAAAEREADEDEQEDADIFDEDAPELDVDELGGDIDEDVRADSTEDTQATWSTAQPGGASVVNPVVPLVDGAQISVVISNQIDKILWIFWRRADSEEETIFKEIPASSTSTLRTYADQVIVLRESSDPASRIAAEFRMTADDNQNFALTADGEAMTLENGGKVHVRFFNKGDADLRILWGNPDDNSELDLGLVQAGGGAYSFNSFVHHEFRLKRVDSDETVHRVKTNEESEQTYYITEKEVVLAQSADAADKDVNVKEEEL
jgi:hypothetical protein